MNRKRRPPLSLADLFQEGPPCRVRDLMAATSLSRDAVIEAIERGQVRALRHAGRTSPYLIARQDARAWLSAIGLAPSAPARWQW